MLPTVAAVSAPASTAAGGKTAPMVLYHISSEAAAAPCAATGVSALDAAKKVPSVSVAEQSVPERKPSGCGGSGP